MRSLKRLAAIVFVLLLASPVYAYSPSTAAVGDYVTKSTGSDRGYVAPTKTQFSTTQLFISNNPESMKATTIFVGKASVLGYTNLQVGKTYRIYVAHTNNYGSTLNLALVLKGSTAGTFTLTKKAVSIGTNYATVGVNSARDFLNSSYNQTLDIPTSWTYYDGPYTVESSQSFQGWWEITVNSGSGVALGVSAAPAGVNIQTAWRTGNTEDAPKEPMGSEDHLAVGLFKSLKTVDLTVDLDTYQSVGAYSKDRLGHYFGDQTDPKADSGVGNSGTNDGWVAEAFSGSGQGSTYLPGNYGAIYRYQITFRSTLGRKGAVLIGRNPAQGGTTGSIGLVLKPSGGSAISLGPITNPDTSKAWLVVKDVAGTAGGTTISFDVLVPGNIELPYTVYFERVL